MTNSFDCPTCHNSGRLGDSRGSVIPCPDCQRGAEYRRQSESQPSIGDAWTPAHAAVLLKAVLYVAATAMAFALYRFTTDNAVGDSVVGPDSEAGSSAAEYSTWEPEQ
jgi:hypothetical protein